MDLRGPGLAVSVVLGILFPYIVLKTDAFGLVGGSHYANLLKLSFNLGYSNMAFGAMVGIAGLGCWASCCTTSPRGKRLGSA